MPFPWVPVPYSNLPYFHDPYPGYTLPTPIPALKYDVVIYLRVINDINVYINIKPHRCKSANH